MKLSGAALLALALRGKVEGYHDIPQSVETSAVKELEQKIVATQIPVIEYHYPGYKGAGAEEPTDFFISQMDFLKEGDFKTLTDTELAGFLDSSAVFPAKSVAFRIDQGAAHFSEFEAMIPELKKRGFHAMVFVITGEVYGQENWNKLINWVKEGVISLGSHSVTHPLFRNISREQALNEAESSKMFIENKLAQAGINKKVVGFAFPGDSVPDNTDFLKQSGYKFAFGGNEYGAKNNAAKPNQFLLGTIYPYVLTSTLEILSANARNNPRSVPLNSGYTFDSLIFSNLTPITVQAVENVTNANYSELAFGKIRYLPTSPEQERHLTKPEGIIIHTDDQSGLNFRNWNTNATYETLVGRTLDVHFTVGLDGVNQFLKMYKDLVTPTRAATGFSNYISIEMCGRDYNDILAASANSEKKKSIETITLMTVQLVKTLAQTFQIDFAKILGHYEATAAGKTDPGQNYMDNYFRPLLFASLQKDIRRNPRPNLHRID